PPPEGPIGRQHDEADCGHVLLDLERTDGLEETELLERETRRVAVLRVDPRPHYEGDEIEDNDRPHVGYARHAAQARNERTRHFAHRPPQRYRLVCDRSEQTHRHT